MSRESSGATGAAHGVYLDWNATSPPHPDVVEAMARAARDTWGNPSSVHGAGRAARAVVEGAREALAELCGVEPRDVVLTSGATEANNLALAHAPALVTSRLEHPSVVRVAEAVEGAGRVVRWLPVPSSGRLLPSDVAAGLHGLPAGTVVAVMAANHETGVLQPLHEVAEIAAARGCRLHVDAAQAAGKLPPEELRLGDSLSLAGHKLRGPKGIGALVLRSGGLPRPVLLGGAQERGIRPGTLDPVAAAGLAVAVRRAQDGGAARALLLAKLRDALEVALAHVARVNGGDAPRLPHVASLAFHRIRGDELVAALDLAGIQVSSGSACSAGTSEASPVIMAMLGKARAESTVRVSLGETTTAGDIERTIAAVIRLVTGQSSPGRDLT